MPGVVARKRPFFETLLSSTLYLRNLFTPSLAVQCIRPYTNIRVMKCKVAAMYCQQMSCSHILRLA
jgi:hypothetical protein